MTEQRYKAVLAVIADGRTVTEVARDLGVSRQTMHVWLARYEEEGLEGLSNRSHRPAHSPHQMPAVWEAKVLETRRAKPYWGARRLALELTRKGGAEPPRKCQAPPHQQPPGTSAFLWVASLHARPSQRRPPWTSSQ